MKKIAIVLVLSTSFAANSGLAASQSQGSGPSPYTECGIGAALFPDTSWAAVTSNVIWDLGSTALSSALSSPEMCSPKKVKTAKLILETLPQLEKDVAMGQGKYLTAMMETAGCAPSVQGKVATKLRASYASTVSTPEYATQSRTDRAAAFYNDARDAMASTTCNVVL
ncbi:MAG: DUF3015 family protein [Rickettsiales bacterium]